MPTTVVATGPGTTTIVDDAAAAILAQTAVLSVISTTIIAIKGVPNPLNPNPNVGTLVGIEAQLYWIGQSLAILADNSKTISQGFTKIETGIAGMVSAANTTNAVASTALAQQIATDTQSTALAKQALEESGRTLPAAPSLKEQAALISERLKEAAVITQTLRSGTYLKDLLSHTVEDIGKYLTSTTIYTGITAWLTGIKNTITTVVVPSLERAASQAAAFLSSKSPK